MAPSTFSTLRNRLRQGRKQAHLLQEDEPPQQPQPPPPPVTISTENAHNQAQSPLFSAIPPEIRNEIFRLALRQYVDPEGLYEQETYWTRPGFEGHTRIDTALLRTCKRVWGETKDLLGKDCEVVFYLGYKERAPKGEP
jgi:hypothetical protein